MDMTKVTRPARKLRQRRIMGQGDSARDFDTSESMKNAGILDVFPIFRTARLGQKIRRSPQSPLCGVALTKLRRCGAVIVAAGSASRMGGIDKVMAPLGGEPMIVRTVRAFQDCDAIRDIVVVTREDLIRPITSLCAGMDKVIAVVAGGASRQESVHLGLNALPGKTELAAIHDGARPLVSYEVIDRAVRAANTYGAAAPAVPVKDTVKQVQGGVVTATPDRASLRAVQTPQVFDFDLLRGALKKAKDEGAQVTDDCSAVERMGFSVKIVEGEERNIKVTTPMDLKIAEMLLEEMK